MIVQVAARWNMDVISYCNRYSYPEFRLHFTAFTKANMAPVAPFLAMLSSGGGDDEGEDNAQDAAPAEGRERAKPRWPRSRGKVNGMPDWWRARPNVAYTYIPITTSPARMMLHRAQFGLDRLAPQDGVAP